MMIIELIVFSQDTIIGLKLVSVLLKLILRFIAEKSWIWRLFLTNFSNLLSSDYSSVTFLALYFLFFLMIKNGLVFEKIRCLQLVKEKNSGEKSFS